MIAACVALSEWLVRRTVLRHAGTAMLVIVVGALVSNAGLIPTSSHAVYDGVFVYIAPISIFWLLLRVNLRRVLDAGLPLLGLFLLGSGGTVLGVLAGIALLGEAPFGDQTPALAGMFAATYTGGSANFNALALHYGVMKEGSIYAGAMAVDSGLTAVWMAATIFLARTFGRGPTENAPTQTTGPDEDADRQSVDPLDLAVLLALGLTASWAAQSLASLLADAGFAVPSILLLTIMALALAQTRFVASLRGIAPLAMFSIYVFLAVIGALCDVAVLASLGTTGWQLLLLASVCIAVHGAVTFGGARLFRLDPVLAAVASQANVGGGTTALALARGVGRSDLVLPSILVGSVGTALGTFLGFSVAHWLS